MSRAFEGFGSSRVQLSVGACASFLITSRATGGSSLGVSHWLFGFMTIFKGNGERGKRGVAGRWW